MKVSDQNIINALKENDFKDQTELVKYLASKDMEITQAALSRRLKRLGVRKMEGIYKPTLGVVEDIFTKCVLDVVTSPPNLVVVHTTPGFANTFAYFLDERIEERRSEDTEGIFEDIAGTIAGDDTVFIAVKNTKKLEDVYSAMKDLATKGVDTL
ncbi:hypothetical protein ACFLY6_01725 [Candidatus Dependentiae bacterium]